MARKERARPQPHDGSGAHHRRPGCVRSFIAVVLGLIALVAAFGVAVSCSASVRSWALNRLAHFILRDRFVDMPSHLNGAQSVRTVKVRMRDGVLLATHIYLPKGTGPWPVILVRDPYGLAQYGSCTIFVHYGYACVHQDVRGRFGSGGAWYPLINERNDGIDTIRWILSQPWQNRRIALWGESYLGMVQWAMADELPPEVKTFVAGVSHGDIYQIMYHNGMFVEGVGGVWSQTLFQPWTKLFSASKTWRKRFPGQFPALAADKSAFGPAWSSYRDYLTHPEPADPYWHSADYDAIRDSYKGVHVPALLIDRSYDFFLPGMLDAFSGLPTHDQSVMFIGPGDHGGAPGALKVGHPQVRYYADTLAWFDHFLKGKPLPARLAPGYDVYINGADRWQHYDQWPQPTQTLTLYTNGLANAHRCDGGVLADKPGAPEVARYRYDPRNPVPTRGGSFILSGGVAPPAVEDQKNDLCSRQDVLSFSSAPFDHDLLIEGGMHMKLFVASDAADTAFTVKLSEHFADGRVFNIRDDISTLSLRNGATRRVVYHPGDTVEVDFNLIPVEWQVHAGSRLRLDISSSNFPEFNAHPNKGGLWSAVSDPVVAQQTVYGGTIEIPVSTTPLSPAINP